MGALLVLFFFGWCYYINMALPELWHPSHLQSKQELTSLECQ